MAFEYVEPNKPVFLKPPKRKKKVKEIKIETKEVVPEFDPNAYPFSYTDFNLTDEHDSVENDEMSEEEIKKLKTKSEFDKILSKCPKNNVVREFYKKWLADIEAKRNAELKSKIFT